MTDIAVHPEYARAGGFGHLRLGRVEPPEGAVKLALDPYVSASFTPPPASVDYYSAVQEWPMYGNDELGDCTWAAIGHMIQAWTAYAGSMRVPAVKDIEQGYWETGSPPSATGTPNGPTDDGRMEPHVLNYWRGKGVPNEPDSIIGYAAINRSNDDRVKFAIENFGGVYIALALPITAESQSIWDYVDGTSDNERYSWGGHAVPILGYDAEFLYVVTWGFVMKMTWAFWHHYGAACYAIISPDFEKKASAAGVDTSGLQAQIEALTSGAVGGDLPPEPDGSTPSPDPAPEPESAPETSAGTDWLVDADPMIVSAADAERAKTIYLHNLAADRDTLVRAEPANEVTAPAEETP